MSFPAPSSSLSSAPTWMQNRDLLALRSYVLHDSTAQTKNLNAQQQIIVDITHSNLQQRHIEVRFSFSDTVFTLRKYVHRTTGTPPGDQILQIYVNDDDTGGGANERLQCQILPDEHETQLLASFLSSHCHTRVHVVDMNPFSTSANGQLEDTRLVPKFQLTEEEYNQRKNTLRAWATAQKASHPGFTLSQHATDHALLQHSMRCHKRGLPLPDGCVVQNGVVVLTSSTTATTTKSNDIEEVYNEDSVRLAKDSVGKRCQVQPGARRGRIAWVGHFRGDTKKGWWIGVDLDEPLGSNDGSLDGVLYFETTNGNRHGCFARGQNVEIGDYPERSVWEDSDDEEEL